MGSGAAKDAAMVLGGDDNMEIVGMTLLVAMRGPGMLVGSYR